jgi:hypothetical protein
MADNIVSVEQEGMEAPAPRPEPKRDRWSRYLIPDPITGEEKSWIRATTWAAALGEAFALTNYKLRKAALGFAMRPELMVGVAAILDPESKDGGRALDVLINRAQEQAGADERKTLGTALHSFCEAVDTGRRIQIPAPFNADIAAYQRRMRGIKVSANYIERIGLVHELGVAGTMDRLVRFPGYELPMVADVKTGKKKNLNWMEITIQLALYANLTSLWDPVLEHHRKMVEVDRERALVIHLPAAEATCELYLIDVKAGWEMALECGRVRAFRARKDLVELVADWSLK